MKYFYCRPEVGTGATVVRVNSDFNEQSNRVRERVVSQIAMSQAREVAQMIRWKLSKGYVQIPANLTPDLKLRNVVR